MTLTVTEVARHLRRVLNQVEFEGEEIILIRNHHQIARIVPGVAHQTALEAMADLHSTLSPIAGKDWVKDSRPRGKKGRLSELRNPWAT